MRDVDRACLGWLPKVGRHISHSQGFRLRVLQFSFCKKPCLHAAHFNGYREESPLSDTEATERHLTSIGNTEYDVFQDAEGANLR